MKTFTVLYIDDDSELAAGTGLLLKAELAAKNIVTRIFTSEAQINDYLARHTEAPEEQPVLAIVDLWMLDKKTHIPNTEAGFEVIKSLRRLFPAIFVVVVSGHITKETVTKLSAYRAMAVVDKTISPGVLIRKVEEALKAMGTLP